MDIVGGGIFGLLQLIFSIYAIIKIFGSTATLTAKVLWILVVFFIPCFGVIIWWLMGPR